VVCKALAKTETQFLEKKDTPFSFPYYLNALMMIYNLFFSLKNQHTGSILFSASLFCVKQIKRVKMSQHK
jgi:hypothetical protein